MISGVLKSGSSHLPSLEKPSWGYTLELHCMSNQDGDDCQTKEEEFTGDGDFIPVSRRGEVLHASNRSITLAGFTLAFLGLLFNLKLETFPGIKKPAAALLGMFILFVGISEAFRGTAEEGRFELIEYLYEVSTILLVTVCLWTFFILFPLGDLSKYSLAFILTPLAFYLPLKLWHIGRGLLFRYRAG